MRLARLPLAFAPLLAQTLSNHRAVYDAHGMLQPWTPDATPSSAKSSGIWEGPGRGGWQEDAHTDKLHNIVDALTLFP